MTTEIFGYSTFKYLNFTHAVTFTKKNFQLNFTSEQLQKLDFRTTQKQKNKVKKISNLVVQETIKKSFT